MTARRLLLIDNDENFFRILRERVTPYGLEVYRIDETQDALNHVESLTPQLVFIAVEEPDKLGYSLCNKAKKGVARDIPVILTTSSVPPSGFHSHRKLKVHADEYIDKRTMSGEELIGKIDALIGLGVSAVEEMSFDDVEEFDIAEAEDDDRTRVLAPNLLFGAEFDEESSSALAALTGDGGDMGFEEQETSAGLFVPPGRASSPSTGVPEPLDAGQPSAEVEEPAQRPAGVRRAATAPPVSGADAGPPRSGLLRDSGALRSGPASRDSGNIRTLPGRELRSTATPPAGIPVVSAPATRPSGRLPTASELSGGAAPAASSLSRERELLDLRETLNRKEREILDLRDEAGSKDREILEHRERLIQLEHERASLDARNVELEQQVIELTESVGSLDAERTSAASELEGLRGRLQAVEGKLAETERARAQHEQAASALVADKSRLLLELDTLKKQHQDDRARAEAELGALRSKHEAELGALRSKHEAELGALRGKHDNELQRLAAEHLRLLEEARAEVRAALQQEHAQALAERDDKHKAELRSLAEAHTRELEAQRARLAEDRARERAELDARHQAERERERAQAAEERRGAEAALRQEAASAAERTQREHAARVAELDAAVEASRQARAELERRVTELQGQSQGYQDQVLEAYRKIKSDELTVDKAKRALAVALTLLDEHITPVDEAAVGSG